MTNEQREAIDKLTNGEKMDFVTLVRTFKKEGIEKFAVVRKEYLDTVLSLIKEQQEEIENITTNYKNLIADVSMLAKELGLEEDATIDEIYTTIRILKSKRINVIEQLDCIEVKNKEIDKLKAENKDLLRKLRNRVKQVKKLEKYSLYKSEFSRLNKQLKQKDKQIDLMAFNLADYVMYYEYDKCRNPEMIKNKAEEIKQYFERKVEDVKD